MAGPWVPLVLGVVGWLASSTVITLVIARWLKTQAEHDAGCRRSAPPPRNAR
jgi:hypothetical protein